MATERLQIYVLYVVTSAFDYISTVQIYISLCNVTLLKRDRGQWLVEWGQADGN